MSRDDGELTVRQARIVATLISGSSAAKIAKELGVSRRTVERELERDHVRRALADSARASIDAVAAQLGAVASQAASELAKLLASPRLRTPTRLRAIEIALERFAAAAGPADLAGPSWSPAQPAGVDLVEYVLAAESDEAPPPEGAGEAPAGEEDLEALVPPVCPRTTSDRSEGR